MFMCKHAHSIPSTVNALEIPTQNYSCKGAIVQSMSRYNMLAKMTETSIDLSQIVQLNSQCIGNLRSGFCLHAVKGSPMYPSMQVQDGTWFKTLHTALIPHTPGQGSMQCSCWHALLEGQSELTTHSGRHAT